MKKGDSSSTLVVTQVGEGRLYRFFSQEKKAAPPVPGPSYGDMVWKSG